MAVQFRIYQDDNVVASTSNLSHVIQNVPADTLLTFKVTAFDGEKESDPAVLTISTITELRPYVLINRINNVNDSVSFVYNEYNLGLVPIGTEPVGKFGGSADEILTGTVTAVKNNYSVVVFSDDRIADFKGKTFNDLTKPLLASYKRLKLA